MIVPEVTEPITIPLNIRFAVIKRANGKCEDCKRSIKNHPIEAYQIHDKDKKRIGFYALCRDCRKNLKDKIISES